MAIYHDLDNTGQEVQQRLDQVPVTQADLADEVLDRQAAVGAVQNNVDAEELRAKAAEKLNADDIDAIEEKIPSGASSSNKMATASDISSLDAAIDAIEEKIPSGASSSNKMATASDISSLDAAIEAILLLIPSAATSLNKLADKAFVNSSIATATATFRGTKNLVSDLNLAVDATHEQIAVALSEAVSGADNNDYAFVQVPTSSGTPTEIRVTERYKFDGTAWSYEYDLNNSGFTADQWAAINSTITSGLVDKLNALPSNADLTAALGVLTNGIAAINEKIPTAATSSNKLVDTAAMQSYISQILDGIDATFNVTSTDGHVTIQVTQVNGIVTNVAVTTSDIASAAALTIVTGRVTDAEANIVSLGGRMTTAEDDIDDLQQLYNNLQQSVPEIIQPADTWPVANPSTTVIYRVIDRVNTPPQNYSDYMFSASDLTTPVLMATYNNAIDPRPKKGSQNLVTSGGVFDNMGALDVSELNATENPHTLATYADLSAALAAIPSDYQKGGMSIKFVQSSDNKYMQYFLTKDEWSASEADWEKMNLEDEVGELAITLQMASNEKTFGVLTEPDFNLEGYINANGEIVTTYANWKHCDFTPVIGGTMLRCKTLTAYRIAYVAFYTEANESSLISTDSAATGDWAEIFVPQNANYFRASGYASSSYQDTELQYLYKGYGSKRLSEIEDNIKTNTSSLNAAIPIIQGLEETTKEMFSAISKQVNYLPGNPLLINSQYISGELFTSWKIAKYFKKGSFVEYFVFRAKQAITSLDIYEMIISPNGDTSAGSKKESLVVTDDYLDNSYGYDYVYKIPVNKTINYVPAIKSNITIYFNLSNTEGGSGFINSSSNVERCSSKTADIFFGVYSRDYAEIVNLTSFAGKKVGIIGDSISNGQFANKSWGTILSEELGFTLYNQSFNGANLSNLLNTQIPLLPSELDVIFIAGGVNEFLNAPNQSIGEPFVVAGDGTRTLTSDGTIYGLLNQICLTLRQSYPEALIFLVSPLKTCLTTTGEGQVHSAYDKSKSGNFYYEDMLDAFYNISWIHSVPLIDVSRNSLLNSMVSQMAEIYYTHIWSGTGYEDWGRDLTHPTTEGQKLLAKYIKGKLIEFNNILG